VLFVGVRQAKDGRRAGEGSGVEDGKSKASGIARSKTPLSCGRRLSAGVGVSVIRKMMVSEHVDAGLLRSSRPQHAL